MQNSGNGIAKIIITVLALVCVALAVVYVVKNKPDCSDSKPAAEEQTDYSNTDYTENYSVSGGDITVDDNNTEEMDTIPNDAGAPTSSTDS